MLVKVIRQDFGAAANATVTAWVSLAEALIDFYGHPGPHALDRLKRAHVLSRAIQHPVLVPLCAAWLAHMKFNDNRWEPMLVHAVEALQLAQPEHHAALARVSLVIADAFHFAGRYDLAKGWYAAVHRHAVAEGDDAMISAMLHNVATFRTNNVRISEIFGAGDASEVVRAMLEAESTKNYAAVIGTKSLSLLVPLLRAQLLTVEGKYEDAISLFSSNLPDAGAQGMSRLIVGFLADRAWCKLKLGLSDEALEDIQSCVAAVRDDCDPDDLAIAYERISRILESVERRDEASRFREMSIQAFEAYAAEKNNLLARLCSRFADGKLTG